MISFVRHGETALNRDGRLQGRVDAELSARGLEQVARLATRLADLGDRRRLLEPARPGPPNRDRRSPRSPGARSRSTTA